MNPNGCVWLVGAGPGDPELVTLKAVRVLGQAEVVLVDELANPALLEHVSPGARVVHVGKRGGCRSTPQAFIDRLMVREARRGRRVVRLKGGDPSVFGRAAEELAACAQAGIECLIVPGITAASAAAAALGAPLTDRSHGRGVALVTAHTQPGGAPPDWRALSATGLTLVVYMGVMRAAELQRGLLEAGMRTAMPVAIVERASSPRQRVIGTTLADLPGALERAGASSPAVMVIGEHLAQALGALEAAGAGQVPGSPRDGLAVARATAPVPSVPHASLHA
ncbi:MAG TPA: uroporphyrinogen-III C-methyltransferase [Quisquiliibacterium sp.]|nr:uroporphyrinogen-III C-methyltransferase [Quisquiliibacterium sp.]